MSVNLNNLSITAGAQFFAKQVVNVADKLTEFTFHVLDGATTSLGHLLPDLRPTSVGDVVLQIKKTESALFETPEGDVLVEITQDKQGRYTFLVIGENLEPAIIQEGKKKNGGVLWEVRVSTYLQEIVGNSSRVDYGVSAESWRGEKFTDLKKRFSAEGLLRKKGNEVLLKLPDELPMTFKGHQASMKAEIVLKYFYHRRKTPMEEEQSKHWDLLNRLFVGYLYFSGYALSPWVNDHVMLPHQRAQREEEKAQRMAADGYLDEHELREMAQNPTLRQRVMDMAEAQADGGDAKLLSQLEGVKFQPNGYSQTYEYGGTSYEDNHVFATDKEEHSRTACQKNGVCEEFITEKGPENLIYTQKKHGSNKIDVQKATFKKEGEEWKLVKEEKYEEGRVLRLSDRSFASTILAQSQKVIANTASAYLATVITGHSSKLALISSLFHLISQTKAEAVPQVRQIREVKPGSVGFLMRRTAPITLLNPLPDFSLEPGSQLSYNINLAAYCQLSNPNQNLELSIQQANGQPTPAWISMNMGAITPISTLYLGGAYGVAVNAYVAGNYAYVEGTGGMSIVDITTPSNPIVVGLFSSSDALSVVVKGNYAYLIDSNQLKVINIATPTSPTLVTTLSIFGSSTGVSMSAVGNYLYFAAYQASGANSFDLKVVSISNPISPIVVGSLTITTSGQNYGICVSGGYVFVGKSSGFCIVNVSVPSTPVLITTVSTSVFSPGSFLVKGNYLFIGSGAGVSTYDITTISNPVFVQTIYFNGVAGLTLDGNYIYVTYAPNDVYIIDITNPRNAIVVASIPTLGDIRNTFLSNNNIFVSDGLAGLVIFNAGSRVLSGSPSATDRGLLHLNVTAQDDLGNTIVDPITIHVGDINIAMPIPNQQVYVGNSTLFTLPAGTFEYPNANFTYTAQLVGGLPLPSCVNFDPSTRTFLFTPHSGDQNTYRIQVNGDDGFGGTISTTFDLIVPDRLPVLAQPFGNQTAYTGVLFEYIVAPNSFTDADHDQLVYTANLVGSNALPGWLSFDPALLKFSGTPFGRNTYQIHLNANDEYGGITSGTFTITVPSSLPILLNPVGTQLASTNLPFSFTFNSNTFYDFDSDPLTYSTNALPSFLSFNNATRTFTGTPQTQDVGTYTIIINAANPFGGTASATFSLSVISSSNDLPPVLVRAIPDLTITSGIPFNTTFSGGIFEDPQGHNLTYTATLEGGAPLPTGLYFDVNTLTLSGVVPTPQSLRITVKATDPVGAFAIDTFTLTVVDGTKYPPIVLNSLPDASATVGTSFFMQVPTNTFQDLNGDELSIMVTQTGGQPLPEWLKWDAKTLSFSGTPGPFDTNTYSNRQVIIDVWAKDSVGSVKTSFIISVGGESFWASFIKYGFGFGSAAVSVLGVWRERALIWNYLNKDKYRGETERAYVDQHYSHEIKLDRKKVKEISVLFEGKPLFSQKPYPDGLIYEYGELSGTPTNKDLGRFTVRVFDHDGYINEEFDLIIKNSETDPDPDPEKNPSCFESTKIKLSNLQSPTTSKNDDEEEGSGCLGRVKKHLPREFPMKNLGRNHNDDTN